MKKLLELIYLARENVPHFEEDSAEIKGYLRELKLPEEQAIVAEIQELFPEEYGEYLNETGQIN